MLSGQEKFVRLEGALRLEGVFLEMIFASYLISKGRNIVARPATRGLQHDVLINLGSEYGYYECTGRQRIDRGKVDRFLADTLSLDQLLRESEGKGLVEVGFVAACSEDAWTPDAKAAWGEATGIIRNKLGCNVVLLSSNDLLKELISSGVLGLRHVRDRLYWAGPEDLAIRYDPNNKSFEFKHTDSHLIRKLKETHYGLLPSYYWDNYYRTLFEEAVRDKEELPLSVFTYSYDEGIHFGREGVKNMVELYAEYINSFNRDYVLDKGEDYILETWKSRRGNYSYILYLFTLGEEEKYGSSRYVSSNLVRGLKGRADILAHKFKSEGKVPKDEHISLCIAAGTQYWSSLAWGEVPEIPKAMKEELWYARHIAADELVMQLLNKGVLGLRYDKENRVCMVGPRVQAVRLGYEVDGLKITISDKVWYT